MRRWAYPAFKHWLGSVYDPLDDNKWKRLTWARARRWGIASHFATSKKPVIISQLDGVWHAGRKPEECSKKLA
jgi:hypothetical protein